MTFEPQDIEAVRAYWASYQKLEEEGLVVGTALEDNREDQTMGAAWRRCEAALPEGSSLRLWGASPADQFCEATACLPYSSNRDDVIVSGPTPTAALEALAEKLESLRP